MPIFQMECRRCAYRWEHLRGPNDPIPNKCPTCEGEAFQIMEPVRFNGFAKKPYDMLHGRVPGSRTKVYQTDKRKVRAR